MLIDESTRLQAASQRLVELRREEAVLKSKIAWLESVDPKKVAAQWSGEFALAARLSKHLHELMGWDGPMTLRQWQAWQAWLESQWNVPDRHDHYLMQVAQIAAVGNIKDAESKRTGDYRIEFQMEQLPPAVRSTNADAQFAELKEQGFKVPRRMSKQDIEAAQKNWMLMLGNKPKRPKPPDPRTRAATRGR